MSTIIKSYTSIILIIIAALTFGGIISATIDVRNARDYHAAIVAFMSFRKTKARHKPSLDIFTFDTTH